MTMGCSTQVDLTKALVQLGVVNFYNTLSYPITGAMAVCELHRNVNDAVYDRLQDLQWGLMKRM